MIPHVISTALLLPGLLGTAPPPRMDGPDLVVAKRAVIGTVDALEGAGEYPIPNQVISAGLGTFKMQTYRSTDGLTEEVQLIFNITDNSFNGNDLVRIYIDANHNDAVDAADREVEIRRDNMFKQIGGVNVSGPPSGGVAVATALAQNFPGNWVVEVKLSTAQLGMSGVPAHLGMWIYVLDSGTLTEGIYPAGATGANLDSWATVKTRYPIDYMIVLDQSGSMLSQNKWTQAKTAAGFFRSTMAALADPTYFADRVGLATFAWLCSGGGNLTTTPATTVLGPPGLGLYPPAAVPDPISNNCTPIGEGLKEAFKAGNLNATVPDATQLKDRGVLLLSDGLQNRPGLTFNPIDTGYDLCGVAGWAPCPANVSNVPVSTVAFGSDSNVDTFLLQQIQALYQGDFQTTFDMASDPEALKQAFINSLLDFYTSNLLAVAGTTFAVSGANDRLVVIASWANPANAENIGLTNPGPVPCTTPASSDTNVGFAVCVVDNPPAAATYTVVAADGGFGTAPTTLFPILDLQLRALFSVDPLNAGTGQPLLLTVQLRDAGQPVLNNPPGNPVRVRVRIEMPEEGVGTFASTTDPQTCKPATPRLPSPMSTDPQRTGPRVAASMPAGTTFGAGAAAGTLDPQPPLYALVSQLLDACGRAGLPRGDDGLEMYDDATHGDVTAGDGVYSLSYTPDVEGTYVFHFSVDGTSAAGEPFTRARRMGKYVRVLPAPASSPGGSRILQQGAGMVTAEYWVLPRDRFGGYLGPGRASHVDFVIQGNGSFAGPVIDYGNGYYARRVQYDPSQGAPVVTPTVNGVPLRPLRPGMVLPSGGGRGRFELGVFAAFTGFDDALGLDDGPGLGARLGFGLIPALTLEGEGAVTWTANAASETGQMLQLLGGARLDLSGGMWETFVRGGAGKVFFRGFTADDDAMAYHGGGGFTLWMGGLGVRADARALRINAVGGAGATTNWQGQAGVVIRF